MALGGCTADAPAPPAPSRTAEAETIDPGPVDEAADGRGDLALADGWDDALVLDVTGARIPVPGEDLEVVGAIDSAPDPDGQVRLASVTALWPDGDVLVHVTTNPDDEHGAIGLHPSVPMVVAPDGTQRPLAVVPSDGVHRQAPYAHAHGEHVVWMETASTDLYTLDWRIVAASADGSQAVVVADWSQYTDEPPPLVGAEVLPSAGQGWVAWNAPLPSAGAGWRGSGYDQRVLVTHGGEVTGLERPAAVHASGGKDLYVARDSTVDPTIPTGRYEIVRIAPGPDMAEEVVAEGGLPADGRISDLAADGASVAWIVSGGPRAAVHVLDGARTVVVRAPDPMSSARMSLSSGRLAWGEGSGGSATDAHGDGGTYLLDTDDTLWRLASSPGLSAAGAAGDWVAWRQVADDGRSSTTFVARWLR